MIKTLSLISAVLIATSFISVANGQQVRDAIYEDEVIVCLNGHVVGLSGNICKVFSQDDIMNKDGLFLMEDMFQNPQTSDTFDMEVID